MIRGFFGVVIHPARPLLLIGGAGSPDVFDTVTTCLHAFARVIPFFVFKPSREHCGLEKTLVFLSPVRQVIGLQFVGYFLIPRSNLTWENLFLN